MSTEDNKAVARRAFDVINTGNLDVVDELIAPEYLYSAPGTPEVRGPEGWKQLISMYRAAFPDLHMTVDDVLAEGDKVAVRWSATGTHRGELMGIPPTGKRVTVTGMIMSRCAGGKFVEEHEIFDSLGMLQQLGAVPTAAGSTA
jgi:steroid delta-isomerase-like uncharacterized protein